MVIISIVILIGIVHLKKFEYKSKYNKLPSKHDKDPEVKKLGEWILTQNKNYKNKTQIMSNEIIYNKWKNFI